MWPAGRTMRALALGGMLAAGVAAVPSAARADCDIPDNGIPEESVLSKVGPGWASLGTVLGGSSGPSSLNVRALVFIRRTSASSTVCDVTPR